VNLTFRSLLALVLSSSVVSAQGNPVVVRGSVVDRESGRPLAGAYVAFPAEARGWTVADSLGQFVLSAQVRNRQTLLVTCPRPSGAWGATLDSLRIDLQPSLDTVIVVLVTSAQCALPPYTERHLELGGVFATGFETNRFIPDPDSSGRPLFWGGEARGRYAVVSWSAVGQAQRPTWPDSPGDPTSPYCYRVRWVGTLTGPGRRNPVAIDMRVAAYSFVVDSTISVVAEPVASCAPPR
jgi:hypothetical protein